MGDSTELENTFTGEFMGDHSRAGTCMATPATLPKPVFSLYFMPCQGAVSLSVVPFW